MFATPTYYVNGTRYIGARTTFEFRVLVDAIARRPVIAAPAATDAPAATTDAPAGSSATR